MDLRQHIGTTEWDSLVTNGHTYTSDTSLQRQKSVSSETQKITKTKTGNNVLENIQSDSMPMIHHCNIADCLKNVRLHGPIVLICYWHVIHYKQETTWRQRLVTDTTHRGAAGDQTSSIITHEVVQSNHDINWTDMSIMWVPSCRASSI
jgi:hypothetical protein